MSGTSRSRSPVPANAEINAGDISSSAGASRCPSGSKKLGADLEVATPRWMRLLLADAGARFEGGGYRPEPLDYRRPSVTGRLRRPCQQEHRRIDWLTETMSSVLAKLRAADYPARRARRHRRNRSCSCSAGTRKISCEVIRGRSWRAGAARSAGRPWMARSGSRSCAGAGSPAGRPPSSCRRRLRSAEQPPMCRRPSHRWP